MTWSDLAQAAMSEAQPDVQSTKSRCAQHVDAHGPPADLGRIVAGCAWLRHCRDDAPTLPEPEWFAMISIVGRCADGENHVHAWSRPHPRYNHEETAAKLAHALEDAGPRSCRNIREALGGERYCAVCPHWDTITSPIQLGRPGSEPAPTARAARTDLVLDEHAEPPADKLSELLLSNPKFRDTWLHKRPDLSAEADYDVTLVDLTLSAGWTNQETANLLVAFRRKHPLGAANGPPPEEVGRAIAKGRERQAGRSAQAELNQLSRTDAPLGDQARKRILAMLSRLFGVDVAGWRQFGRENAEFTLVLRDGTSIMIGGAADVVRQSAFRERVYEAASKLPAQMKAEEWTGVCRALAQIVEVRDNIEGTRVARLIEFVDAYLDKTQVCDAQRRADAVDFNLPFRDSDGLLRIRARQLAMFISREFGVRVELRDVHCLLHAAGFATEKVDVRTADGRHVNRLYWIDWKARFGGGTEPSEYSPHGAAAEKSAGGRPQNRQNEQNG